MRFKKLYPNFKFVRDVIGFTLLFLFLSWLLSFFDIVGTDVIVGIPLLSLALLVLDLIARILCVRRGETVEYPQIWQLSRIENLVIALGSVPFGIVIAYTTAYFKEINSIPFIVFVSLCMPVSIILAHELSKSKTSKK